jgi:hypothetical protein
MSARMRNASLCATLALAVLAIFHAGRTTAEDPPRGGPGRFASPPSPLDLYAVLDTYTGVIYLAKGTAGAGEQYVLDLPNHRLVKHALAKDVTGGTMVLPVLPNPAGAATPVFGWSQVKGESYAIVDTRNGIVLAVVGTLEAGEVHRYDVRNATHSKHELKVVEAGK